MWEKKIQALVGNWKGRVLIEALGKLSKRNHRRTPWGAFELRRLSPFRIYLVFVIFAARPCGSVSLFRMRRGRNLVSVPW